MALPMIAQLIPVDGSKPITIDRNLTIVGRKEGLCDLVVDCASVSKLHCAVAKTDGLLFIRDLGSTNGTKVNGQRVTRGALLPGDELAFANVRFRVHLGPSPSSLNDQTEALADLASALNADSDAELVGVDSQTGLPFLQDDED